MPDHFSTRRDFLKKAGMGISAMALPRVSSAFKMSDRMPNILFIMSDDHAANAISTYGSRINQTPNIDRLANEGMKFNNCFCTNSICAPSRAVILTGKYSHLNGVRGNETAIKPSQTLFTSYMSAAGYETAMIGKWHLVSYPTQFDYWQILYNQGEYVNPYMRDMYGKTHFYSGYTTDIITDLTMDWLNNRDKSKPFCLFCQHKAVHGPFISDEKHENLFQEDVPIPVTLHDDYSTRCDAIRQARTKVDNLNFGGDPPAGLSKKEAREWRYQQYIKRYLRCVASLDDNIGRLLEYLEQNDLADDTVVVYTSDQGFFLGEHGLYDKRFMYEEALRMPLIIRYPREIVPASVSDEIVLNLDFAPTFLDYAGIAKPEDMQGESFRSVLQSSPSPDWRSSIYYHYYGGLGVQKHYGVRTQRFKLIHFYDDSLDAWEFYDLQQDPNEVNNLYDNPNYAAKIEELKAEITNLRIKYQIEKPSSIEENQAEVSPDDFTLWQNYPNPFNSETEINFMIPASDVVSLKIYDMNGREIQTLIDRKLSAGLHSFIFNAETLPSATYYIKLQTGKFTQSRKLTLIR